jgi:hypothetical protein
MSLVVFRWDSQRDTIMSLVVCRGSQIDTIMSLVVYRGSQRDTIMSLVVCKGVTKRHYYVSSCL